MEYREFRIQIRNRQEVQVVRPGGIPISPPPRVPMDLLHERTIKVLSRYVAAGSVDTRDELVVLGSHLFTGLFEDSLHATFAEELDRVKQTSDTVLRLVLEFTREARELAELPWEYLYFPDDDRGQGFFIAADPESRLILARHVPMILPQLQATSRPLRILVVVSQPEVFPDGEPELGQVVATKVVQGIDQLAAGSEGAIEATTLRQPTERTLTDEIKRVAPHVVHFLGHGRYVEKSGGALALLRDDNKTLSWISDRDLPNCFNPAPRLVFLHACEGAHTDSYDAFRGVALQLVYTKIPAVVAMQYQVENKVANMFALRFYESLSEGKRIDEAVQDGRRELGMFLKEQDFSSRAFGSPVVFLQNAEGPIINVRDAAIDEPRGALGDVRLRCPNCSADVTSNTQQFCYKCPAVLTNLPRCRACGQLMPTDAGRCGDCGIAIEQGGAATPDVVHLSSARSRGAAASGYAAPASSPPRPLQRDDPEGAKAGQRPDLLHNARNDGA